MAEVKSSFDVVVLGGGPGGYVAAIRASQLGLSVGLIEANHLGGICLNWGCIPTKALLRSSEIVHLISHEAENFGVQVAKPQVDFEKVIQRSRDISAQLAGGIKHLMKKNKVQVFEGYGKLKGGVRGARTLEITKEDKSVHSITAKNVIIATGAKARNLPGLEVDGESIWSYREAMTPKALPKSLLVVGTGAIGVEFASFYSAMGTQVTLIEIQNRILPVEDAEISTLARKAFEQKGMSILTETSITKLDKKKTGIDVTLKTPKGEQTLTVERIISAVGIVANSDNLGLEGTKVKIEKTHIQTNEFCETHEIGIYAIGDVSGAPWLAHKASHEGVLAAEHIAGVKNLKGIKRENIPGCTYSSPQIASIGLTEEQAKIKGEIKVGRFPFMGNGKAIALGEPQGLIKTIFDAKTGELLGAHMIGAEVTEMIQGFAIAKTLEATEADLMHTIFPHPTLSEMMHESVLDAFGKVIHF